MCFNSLHTPKMLDQDIIKKDKGSTAHLHETILFMYETNNEGKGMIIERHDDY